MGCIRGQTEGFTVPLTQPSFTKYNNFINAQALQGGGKIVEVAFRATYVHLAYAEGGVQLAGDNLNLLAWTRRR